MSQCSRVLNVLREGGWKSIQEIHQRAGTMRLNSRISDLRLKHGCRIEYRIVDGLHSYRLLNEPGDSERLHEAPSGLSGSLSGTVRADQGASDGGSLGEDGRPGLLGPLATVPSPTEDSSDAGPVQTPLSPPAQLSIWSAAA